MKFSLLFILFFLLGCSSEPSYEVSDWNKLIDPHFDQEKVVNFYKEKVSHTKEGSKEEINIYAQLQNALKSTGNNKAMDGKTARLSGYIVPVDTQEDKVTKFLFFPNQAACIHVPASPANQTIYVSTSVENGVLLEDAYEEIYIFGTLKLHHTQVATGNASFIMQDAVSRVVPQL